MGFINGKTEIGMKESGGLVCDMAMDQISLQMGTHMLGSTAMVTLVELACTNGLMGINIRASS
jgi:allophanate hydrolase subunit 2